MRQQINIWMKSLKRQTCALYLASRHARVSPLAKLLIIVIIAYVLSPIDLIPDFIPVIGYFDDLLILPLGILLVIKMIPADLWQECLKQADDNMAMDSPYRKIAAAMIIIIWLLAAAVIAPLIVGWLS